MDYPYGNGYQNQAYAPQQYQYNAANQGTMQQQMWQPQRQAQDQMWHQQAQQAAAQRSILGRMVQSEADLLPSDVTSDGNWSWYPMQNGSYVIGRRMDKDFNVTTLRFVPETQQPPQPTQADRIEEKLNRLLGILEAKPEEVAEDAR